MYEAGPRGATKPRSVQLVFAALLLAVVGIQVRVPIGNTLPAELVLVALFITAVSRLRVPRPPRALSMALGLWTVAAIVAYAVSSNPDFTLRAIRNVSALMLTLITLSICGFNQDQMAKLLKVLSYSAAAVALLGVHQAIFGYDSSATLYTLKLVGKDEESLLDVVQWKLDNIQDAHLAFGRDLALGLHMYSNNFAEYLVYGAIATFGVRRLGRMRRVIYIPATALIFTAIVLSGSRTCQIGWAIVFAHHLTSTFRKRRHRIFIWMLLGIAATAFLLTSEFAGAFFGYDKLGTVEGRTFLGLAAINEITSSLSTIVVGGNTAAFYERFTQSPHNLFLFLALFFGIPLAFGAGLLIFWVGRRSLAISLHAQSHEDKALAQVALISTVWFFLYGMTWSVVEDALSGILWASMATYALPLVVRRLPSQTIPSRKIGEVAAISPLDAAQTQRP